MTLSQSHHPATCTKIHVFGDQLMKTCAPEILAFVGSLASMPHSNVPSFFVMKQVGDLFIPQCRFSVKLIQHLKLRHPSCVCHNEVKYDGGQNTTSLLVVIKHVSAYWEAIFRFTRC
jgi:hypothetical protein